VYIDRQYIYIYCYHVYLVGGWAVVFIFRNVCSDFLFLFFRRGLVYSVCTPGNNWNRKPFIPFCQIFDRTLESRVILLIYFLFLYIYIYMYISKAQYCARREIAEVVDFFSSSFFLRITEKPRESQSEIVSRQHCLVCVCIGVYVYTASHPERFGRLAFFFCQNIIDIHPYM